MEAQAHGGYRMMILNESTENKHYSQGQMMEKTNLKGSYVERDVSWMYFNQRILQEAEKADVPVLERSNIDSLFRCGPYVMLENGIFRMWYVAGNSWTNINGKDLPNYTIKQ